MGFKSRFFIFSLVALVALVAVRLRAQTVELSAQEYPALFIKAHQVEVKVSEYPGSTLKITGISNSSLWTLKNLNGKGLLIEQVLNSNRKELVSGSDLVKPKIVIQTPSIPLDISAYRLGLLVENLRREIKVVSTIGNLKFVKTVGDLNLAMINGDITIESHNGKVHADSDQAKIHIKNSISDGEFKVQNLKMDMDMSQGHQQINSYSGILSLNQNRGSFQIEMTKGSISSISNQGLLEAIVDEANTEVRLSKDNEVNIKSKSGKVFVNTNKVPGIWLNLKSSEAEVYLPSPHRAQKLKAETIFKGRTTGEKTLTRVEIKTINAPIIIK